MDKDNIEIVKTKMLASFSVMVAFGVFALLCLPQLIGGARRNGWSLEYLYYRMQPNPAEANVLPAPPSEHDRSAFWLARNALANGDLAQAQSLVSNLAVQRDADALVIMGEIFAVRGDFAAAVDVWLQATAFYVLLDAADLAQRERRLGDALLAYTAAYQINVADGTQPLAKFLWAHHGAQEAEVLLRQVLEKFPDDPERRKWILLLGAVLQEQERFEEAIALYRQEISRAPHVNLYVDLGWAYYAAGNRPDVVAAEFRKAVELFPSAGEGYFAIGQILANQKKYTETDEWFVQAVALNPDNDLWHVNRADAARDGGDLALALPIYQAVIKKTPDFAKAYYQIAWAYRLNDNSKKAIEAIETAIVLVHPANTWYYIRVAKIYEWVGDLSTATGAYIQALEIDPAHEAAQKGLIRIENLSDD